MSSNSSPGHAIASREFRDALGRINEGLSLVDVYPLLPAGFAYSLTAFGAFTSIELRQLTTLLELTPFNCDPPPALPPIHRHHTNWTLNALVHTFIYLPIRLPSVGRHSRSSYRLPRPRPQHCISPCTLRDIMQGSRVLLRASAREFLVVHVRGFHYLHHPTNFQRLSQPARRHQCRHPYLLHEPVGDTLALHPKIRVKRSRGRWHREGLRREYGRVRPGAGEWRCGRREGGGWEEWEE
jgi:hypothetical protein